MSKQQTTQQPYGDLTTKELKALVEERTLTDAVKPTGSGNRVVKADLVKTLQAADKPSKKPTPKKADRSDFDWALARKQAKQYRGVGFHPQSRRFQAQTRQTYIGLFETALEAAQAYDQVARELGDTVLNFPKKNDAVLDDERVAVVVERIQAKALKAAAETPKEEEQAENA